MKDVVFHSHPNSRYRGSVVRGFAEITKKDTIAFNLTVNPYVPATAKTTFKNDIKAYRKYVASFLSRIELNRRMKSLTGDGYYIEDNAVSVNLSFISEFERIYDNVSITVQCRIGATNVNDNLSIHDEFIMKMLRKCDTMFLDIERESNQQILFMPNNLGKMRVENKMRLMTTGTPKHHSYLKSIFTADRK